MSRRVCAALVLARVRDEATAASSRVASLVPPTRCLQMFAIDGPRVDRRKLLIGSSGAAAVALHPGIVRGAPPSTREFKLTAAPARLRIVGRPSRDTDVWCYGGRVPGPELRVRQGQPVH